MGTLRERIDACDAVVRSHLGPDEQVLAIGKCEDITLMGGIEAAGAAWTFVMVTDSCLRWVPHVRMKFEASLVLDDITAAVETRQEHRYAIELEHRPLQRPHRVGS